MYVIDSIFAYLDREVKYIEETESSIDYVFKTDITKHSFDIIDLIECGDYVNGKYVFDVFEKDGKKYLKVDCMYGYYSEDEIGEVVTHESFNSIKYEVK